MPQYFVVWRWATIRMKVLPGFCRTNGDGAYGCRSPPWRRRRDMSPYPSPIWGKSADLEHHWHYGGILNVVSLFGSIVFGDTARRSYVAIIQCLSLSKLELLRHNLSSTVSPRRCLLRVDQVPPSICHLLYLGIKSEWCVDDGNSVGDVFLRRCPLSIKTWRCTQLWTISFSLLVVLLLVAIFGLAEMWSSCYAHFFIASYSVFVLAIMSSSH
jgi:hypothetical protein